MRGKWKKAENLRGCEKHATTTQDCPALPIAVCDFRGGVNGFTTSNNCQHPDRRVVPSPVHRGVRRFHFLYSFSCSFSLLSNFVIFSSFLFLGLCRNTKMCRKIHWLFLGKADICRKIVACICPKVTGAVHVRNRLAECYTHPCCMG